MFDKNPLQKKTLEERKQDVTGQMAKENDPSKNYDLLRFKSAETSYSQIKARELRMKATQQGYSTPENLENFIQEKEQKLPQQDQQRPQNPENLQETLLKLAKDREEGRRKPVIDRLVPLRKQAKNEMRRQTVEEFRKLIGQETAFKEKYTELSAEQKSLVNKGIERLIKIRDTKPKTSQKRDARNKEALARYDERYQTEVKSHEGQEGDKQYKVETTVKGYENPCYENFFYNDRSVQIVDNYRDVPEVPGYIEKLVQTTDLSEEEVLKSGKFDSKAPYKDTKPIRHAEIMYSQSEKVNEKVQKEAKESPGSEKPLSFDKWEDQDVIEPNSQRMVDLFLNGKVTETFHEDHPAYYAVVAAPIGNGKWYLAEHHLDKEISSVEMRKVPKDGEMKYYIGYNFKEKEPTTE